MSGKTVEEVARACLDGVYVRGVELDELRQRIAIALRQREQETAAECARIVTALADDWQRFDEGYADALNEAAAAINSRFPKDACNG